jgi:nucleotide-binding universal stress UspA family protein
MIDNIVDRPIVVGVDGSASALHAARWAADEAAGRHIPLRLVHGVNTSVRAGTGGVALPQSFFDALERDGRQTLAEAETAIRQQHPGLDVGVDLYTADPVPTLIEVSKHARLVVLGSRGRGGFTGVLAGSTAVALVAHGHCPVAVIRGRSPDEASPSRGAVVVGVDGSPAGESALAMAFDEASWRGADLIAVHTWIEFYSNSSSASAGQFLVDWDALETCERELLAERMAGWQEKYPDVEVRRVVTRDRPVRCLLEHAADAQLLVVGRRGRGGLFGMLLGSTSQALMYHAPCPLMVVRPAATP